MARKTREKEKITEKKQLTSESLTKERKSELRSLLIGDIRLNDEGKLVSGGRKLITPWGAGDGALSVTFLGIRRKTFHYTSLLKNNKQASFRSVKAMQNIGRVIYMQTAPDAACCFIRRPFVRATVLIFEEDTDKKGLTLEAYCGRSPFAFWAMKKAVGYFEKEMKGKIKRIE